MEKQNIYAPPKANVSRLGSGDCTRDGKSVIVPVGSDLPPRCIACNAPVTSPIKSKKVYWHSPWIYVLVPINMLLYLIVGLIARKSFEVSAGLCETHANIRKWRMLTLALTGTGAFIAAIVLLNHEQGEMAIILFLLALLIFVIAALSSRKVYAKKITKEYAKLAGCKEPFLASLD